MASNSQDDTSESENTGQGIYELDGEGWRQRAENFFKEMQPPSIQPLSEEHVFDISKYNSQSGCNTREGWRQCAEAIEKYDANTCKAHREEIDTLLVFAGLFSAVVTAFTIESYQWLQSDPNDAIIELLSQMIQPGDQSPVPVPAGLPDAVSARINAYWFLSLTLSLASALVAILCKQWVREFERRGDQTHEVFIGVRQTKLEGFEGWGVASVVAAIPLLLQSALGLFALGLIELLWILHTAVAIVVLIPTLAVLIFYGVTTLLPGLQLVCDLNGALLSVSQCPFKSPQALLTLRMLIPLWRRASCPRVIHITIVFFYRHCLVFCRRIYACFLPDYMARLHPCVLPTVPVGDDSHGQVWHSLWRRIWAPWQCPSHLFYQHSLDSPSWHGFFHWRRTHHHRAQDRVAGWRLHSSVLPPLLPHSFESWAVIDRDLAARRDEVYDYTQALEADRDHLPLRACFRGLEWLRAQIDHPDRPQWMWLSIWDLAIRAECLDKPERERRAELAAIVNGGLTTESEAERMPCHRVALHFCYYMRQTAGIPLHDDKRFLQPISLALYCGMFSGVNAAVLGKIFVYVLPHLHIGIAPFIWHMLRERLANHQDVWHSVLHAILAQLLNNDTGDRGNGPTFLSTAPDTDTASDLGLGPRRVLDLMTQSELACLIALRFRELRSFGADAARDYKLPGDLVDVTLISAAANRGSPRYSAAVKSTFSALALDFDRLLEQSSVQGRSVSLPYTLFDAEYRLVYFDLLRHAQGESLGSPAHTAAAEARLVRQLSRVMKMDGVQEYKPDKGWVDLHAYVMGWPALREAVLRRPEETSAFITEVEPSSE